MIYRRTTINVHISVRLLIELIKEKTGLSENEIILFALHRLVLQMVGKKPRHLKQVKYQKSDPGNYSPLAVKFLLTEYEYFTDIRHILRMTSSLLISACIVLCYNKLVNGEFSSDDIRPFPPHASAGIITKGVQFWVQGWDIRDKNDYLPYNYLTDST